MRRIKIWSPKNPEEVHKRAGGRRSHNAERREHRDERQLILFTLLVKVGWRRYGVGRLFAKALAVDPATISRDTKCIRDFRAELLSSPHVNEQFADAIILGLVTEGIHPRFGYGWKYNYKAGFPLLSIYSVGRALPAPTILRIRRVLARVESHETIAPLLSQIGATANVVPDPEIIKHAKARGVLDILKRIEISERVIPNPREPGKPFRSIKTKAENHSALKAAKKLAAMIECENLASSLRKDENNRHKKRKNGNESFEASDSQDRAQNQSASEIGHGIEPVLTQLPRVSTSGLSEEAEMRRVAQMLSGLMASGQVLKKRPQKHSQVRPIRGALEITGPQRPKRHSQYRRPIRHPY